MDVAVAVAVKPLFVQTTTEPQMFHLAQIHTFREFHSPFFLSISQSGRKNVSLAPVSAFAYRGMCKRTR